VTIVFRCTEYADFMCCDVCAAVTMLQRLSWFLALSVAFSVAEDEICSYSNSSVMTSADCSGRMLENIPTSLNSNILVWRWCSFVECKHTSKR